MNRPSSQTFRSSVRHRRSGVILLVVLSSLTFFSLLVISYFVFASQARNTAHTTNVSKTREADINGLMEEAMLTLLRDTSDIDNPFYGEGILSDLYGRDGAEMQVADGAISFFGAGFARFSVQTTSGTRLIAQPFDDIYSGRIITFRQGPLRNQSFRVIRSRAGTTTDDFFVEILPEQLEEFGINPNVNLAAVRPLFHRDTSSSTNGYPFWLNGTPRDSRGIGDDGTNLNQTVHVSGLTETLGSTNVGFDLPAALQPNFVRHPDFDSNDSLDKSQTRGDFDEGYDAADYLNWFLSHRNQDDSVIPSFHRPAVINYILNQPVTGDPFDYYRDLAVSLARATMRPLPMAQGQLGSGSQALHSGFTGGNEEFGLRVPLLFSDSPAGEARLNQFARALIGSPDVDNDGDGRPDSIWINLGLPLITSPEGKLLQPLFAPMIEDLSSRLNLNTSGNETLSTMTAGLSANAFWGGGTPQLASIRNAFRGLGYGPSEIVIPTANAGQNTEVQALIAARYGSDAVPGTQNEDPLDILRTGSRPAAHGVAVGGFGFSIDPYGRHAVGIGRDGHLVTAAATSADEKLNDPYEFDPTGQSAGDNPFDFHQLEAILRANDFDTVVLPQEIRDELSGLLSSNPNLARALTTASISMDAPEWSLLDFVQRLSVLAADPNVVNQNLVNQLIAPELRLGRRLDVNRLFSNQLDDDNDNLIDEPTEVNAETNAFASTSPSGYQANPDYNFDQDTVTGRELLARHLYVLMMMVTSDNYNFPNVDAADADDYRARRLAQWAINVVDYRDPDSIMTRFPFDPTPFDADGWTPPAGVENVVWGVESPGLLLRESLCFHDVRLRDTDNDDDLEETKRPANDTSPGPFDNDSDQVRIPQGSAFIELQCVHPVDNSDRIQKFGFSGDIYTNSGRIDLGATNSQGVPVWRLAFSEPHVTAKQAISPLNLRAAEPALASFAPENGQEREIDAALAVASQLDLERFVWFTHFDSQQDIVDLIANAAIGDMNANRVFFAPNALNGNKLLEPGQFLTVAPRRVTHLGSKRIGGAVGKPSDHRFFFDGDDLVLHDAGNNRRTPNLGGAGADDHFTNALTLFVGANRPDNWPADAFQDGHIGLNISAPTRGNNNYYRAPDPDNDGIIADSDFRSYNTGADIDSDGNPDYVLRDAYLDLSDPATYKAIDQPLDMAVTPRILRANGDEPDLGTIENFRTVYLQRLADPTADYDSETNPYRTIDWMSLDLTVFSGEDVESAINGGNDYATRSRQRTGVSPQDPMVRNILYSYETRSGPLAQIAGGADEFFTPPNGIFRNTLGFLNTQEADINPAFEGFTTQIGNAINVVTNHDRNLPNTPYALHPWLNRPFATHLELMMVPACSQTRLLEEFSVATTSDPDIYPDARDPMAPVPPPTPAVQAVFAGPFGHLLNFFHSSDNSGDSNDSAQFVRIFDFVHTLPRFKGEVDFIRPDRLGTATADELFLRDLLRPPFNFQYDNHRHGRVNLNTLSEFPVWRGLMQGHMNGDEFSDDHLGPSNVTDDADMRQLSFNNMIRNRRGYDSDPAANSFGANNFNPNYPTQFAGAYKHALDSHFAPAARSEEKLLRMREANASLLRLSGTFDSVDSVSAGVRNTPGSISHFVRAFAQEPLQTADPAAFQHQNRQRNPFVRYQTLMRMPNLVSDNSQLYLMRMTLGFFEVDASNVNSLGREYNADIGQNERYQATFIIDRSKPVGFSPGENLNVRDTVVFESYAQ